MSTFNLNNEVSARIEELNLEWHPWILDDDEAEGYFGKKRFSKTQIPFWRFYSEHGNIVVEYDYLVQIQEYEPVYAGCKTYLTMASGLTVITNPEHQAKFSVMPLSTTAYLSEQDLLKHLVYAEIELQSRLSKVQKGMFEITGGADTIILSEVKTRV